MQRALPVAAQHTLGHVDCPACLELKKMIVRTGDLGGITFAQAWPIWWEAKQQEIGPKTQKCHKGYRTSLVLFLGDVLLKDIHIGHIVAYRSSRVSAGSGLINHEVNQLKQILEFAGLWSVIAKHYKPLRVRKGGPGYRIELEELKWLFQVCQSKPRWRLAFLCGMVSAQTAAGPNEILNLRLKDVDFNRMQVHFIEGTKVDERVRTIPMTNDCMWALRELELIAKEKGADEPSHYLLPRRAYVAGGRPDPTRPMSSYKRAWMAARLAASKRFPALKHARQYDLRHTAATMMAENPNIDLPTLKEVLGHGPGSKLATDHYFHSARARRKMAVDVLDGLRKPAATAKEIEDSDETEYIQ